MMARRYDGTVARIAGNLLSGQKDLWDRADSEWSGKFEDAARRFAAERGHERVIVRMFDAGGISLDIAGNQGLRRVGYPLDECG